MFSLTAEKCMFGSFSYGNANLGDNVTGRNKTLLVIPNNIHGDENQTRVTWSQH